MGTRLRLILVAAAVMFIAPAAACSPDIPSIAASTNSPIGPGHELGIADSLVGLSSNELQHRLDGIAATGSKWVRFDIQWRSIEPEKGQYNWSQIDQAVNAVVSHNLRPLAVITYAPDWARIAGCDTTLCGPDKPIDYANFAGVVGQRYSQLYPDIQWAYEIWNEANTPEFFGPAADSDQYTRVLCAAYSKIKTYDQKAIVLTTGTAPSATEPGRYNPVDWLRQLYAGGARNCFDAVSHHPYTWPRHPLAEPDDAWGRMSEMHQIMARNGDGAKKIWLTEYGYTTGPPPNTKKVSESAMAEYMSVAIAAYRSYDWAGPLFWYTYQDSGGEDYEGYFGLVRPDGTPKAAYETFRREAAIDNQ